MAWSKEKRAEYMIAYREANRERIKANRRYYYQTHLEQERAKSRIESKVWYNQHKDDPEFREKRNAKQRERYRQRKAMEGI